MPHTSDRNVASSSAQVDVKAKGEKDAPTARPARRTSRTVSLEVDSAANVNPARTELPDREEHQYLEVDAGANILQQELLTRRPKEQRLLVKDEAADMAVDEEDATLGFARRERTVGSEKVLESILHASTVAAAGAPAQPHGQVLAATASALAPAAHYFTAGEGVYIILTVLIALVILALLVLTCTVQCLLRQDDSGGDNRRPRSVRNAQAKRGSIQRLLSEGAGNVSTKNLLFRDEIEDEGGMGLKHISSLRDVEYDETRQREFLKKEPEYVLPESKGIDYMVDEAAVNVGFVWRLAKKGTKQLPLGGPDDLQQAILTNGLQDMKFWFMRYANLKKDSDDGMIFSYMSEKLDMEPMSFILKPFAVASRSSNSKRIGSTSMVYSQKIGCISTNVNPDDEKGMLEDFQMYQLGFDKDTDIGDKLEKLPEELHIFYVKGLRKEEDPPQQCAGCGYQVTFHPSHCCVACAKEPGTHGGRCQKKPMPDRVEHTEDFQVFATASKEDCEAWMNVIDASCRQQLT